MTKMRCFTSFVMTISELYFCGGGVGGEAANLPPHNQIQHKALSFRSAAAVKNLMLFTGQQHLQIYNLQIYIIYLKYELTYLFLLSEKIVSVYQCLALVVS